MNPKHLLESLGVRARKSLSQNFLTSPHWGEKLTDAILEGTYDEVWEIGPGLGALTERLAQECKKPIQAFEFDKTFAPYIQKTYPQVNVHQGDALKAPWSELADGKKINLLSNLPYHLSSPLLFRFIEHKALFPKLVLTFQREFADRLLAEPNTSEYSGLTVLIQLNYELEFLGVIGPGAFFPKPDVDSAAIRFTPKAIDPSLTEALPKLVKAAFGHRRKQLVKNLTGAFPNLPKDEVRALIPENQARAETLSPAQFLSLAAALKPWICEK